MTPGSDSNSANGRSDGRCLDGAAEFCVCLDLSVGVAHCTAGEWGVCDCSIPVGPPTDSVPQTDAGGADAGTADAFELDINVTPDPTCGTGGPRYNDDDFDERMYPGGTCIQCHIEDNRKDDAPIFDVAGTVFPYLHYEDGCAGVAGAEVVITGANGAVTTLTTNSVGNFFARRANIVVPYTALVRYEGREIQMIGEQTDLDCNGCHTQTGLNEAPGRIIIP